MSLDVYLVERVETEVYEANITHNLGGMAEEAGIYQHLWRPEELGITKASELIGSLSIALAILEKDPERFEKFNPKNGWGDYAGLVRFVRHYLAACLAHPDAQIRISR